MKLLVSLIAVLALKPEGILGRPPPDAATGAMDPQRGFPQRTSRRCSVSLATRANPRSAGEQLLRAHKP